MSALLDLPLDAIAKKVKEEKRAARGGAQSGGRGEARQGQKPQHREGGHQKSSRGGNRGRGRGGAGRARGGASGRPNPYRRDDRGDVEDNWTHDKFDTEGSDAKPATPAAPRPSAARREEGHRIKIENLRYDVTEDDLKELFEQHGSVISATIKFDRDGRSTGEAFVSMRSRTEARKAADELNGKSIDNEVMTVTLLPLVAAGTSTPSSSAAATASAPAEASSSSDKYKDLPDIRIAVNTSKRN